MLARCKDCGLPSSLATGEFGADPRCPWESCESLSETQLGWRKCVVILTAFPSLLDTQLERRTLRGTFHFTTAIFVQFQQRILQTMLPCGCNEGAIPALEDKPFLAFDTLAMPSFPIPTQASVRHRILEVISKLDPDTGDETVMEHCRKFGIKIQTAYDLRAWLCKFKNQKHFERHWKILADCDRERTSFPWNPLGSTSEECILAVDHRGIGLLTSRKTSSHPLLQLRAISEGKLAITLNDLAALRCPPLRLHQLLMAKLMNEDSKRQHENRVLSDKNESLKRKMKALRQQINQQAKFNNRLSQKLAGTKEGLRLQQVQCEHLRVGKNRAEERVKALEDSLRAIRGNSAQIDGSSRSKGCHGC